MAYLFVLLLTLLQVNTAWQNNPVNFDDLPTALLTLYEIGSLEIWEVHMLEARLFCWYPARDLSPPIEACLPRSTCARALD